MDESNLVLILTGLIAAAGGWVSNVITNRPKNEENTMGKINVIFQQYEKLNEECEKRNVKLCKENRILRQQKSEVKQENAELKQQLDEALKGGED
ncbi:hypothetical protein ACFOU0_06125 [Salinicoccus sesuvii]|uniref:Holin n=1 Tax=Salinicoccus sesuvii TaxID=868281 RepID=A0ABV7N3F4_9STAP